MEHQEQPTLANVHSKYYETYIKLAKDRLIFLNEDFSKETSSALTALLLYYDHDVPGEDITIYINSNGGDAAALSNIYDVIQMLSSPVKTVCLGKAYSAGAFLLAAGAPGKRYVLPHSQIMIHGLQCVFPSLGEEHPIDSKKYFEFLLNNNDAMLKVLAKHTGHSLDKIKKDCSKDFYMDAKDAVNYGLADQILG